MLRDDAVDSVRRHFGVPDRIGIDDGDGAVAADFHAFGEFGDDGSVATIEAAFGEAILEVAPGADALFAGAAVRAFAEVNPGARARGFREPEPLGETAERRRRRCGIAHGAPISPFPCG